MKENQQPITGLGNGDVSPYVFLCGDPERVPKITATWTDVQEHCRIREYVIHTGVCEGVTLTAASTGIGGPSTAVVMEEIAKTGGKVFIRVGNSGGLGENIVLGDYVITSASVRDEGTSHAYIGPNYPAAASSDVVEALKKAAGNQETPFHVGVSWSIDGFYSRNMVLTDKGDMAPMSFGGFTQSGAAEKIKDMKAARVLNVEMESAAILTLAGLFGLRAGCICTVSDYAPWPGPGQDMISLDKNMTGAIEVALQAMLALATEDAP